MKIFKNALFINFGGIGDEILFLPTLQSFKKKFPNAKITLALEPRSACIKNLSNIIDEIFLLDINNKNKIIELLKIIPFAWKNKFDIVVSSGSNKLIPILLTLTGIKDKYGFYSGKLSSLLLTDTCKLNKNQYAADMYHDLIKDITQDKADVPHISIEGQSIKEADTVVIHPGVSKMSVLKGMVKTYSLGNWIKVIKKLIENGKKVYLAGGPDDEETIFNILKNLGDIIENTNFINYYNQTKNIYDLAKFISTKETLICCDSAPMHIGVAVNTKVVAIFGPTDEKKLLPESENFVAVKKDLSCRPCLFDKSLTTCKQPVCLDITIEDIMAVV